MGAAAEALPSPGTGHLAGAEGGGSGGSVPAGPRLLAGRWAATPRGPEGAGLTEGPAGAEGVSCLEPGCVCVGDGGDSGPQAGDPLGSGIHFLSWCGDSLPKPDRAWPAQPHSHPHPSQLPGVEPHLRCPEGRRENHSLKGPVPPAPRNAPSDVYFERGLWVCLTPFSMYRCSACIWRCVPCVCFLCIWGCRCILSVNSE